MEPWAWLSPHPSSGWCYMFWGGMCNPCASLSVLIKSGEIAFPFRRLFGMHLAQGWAELFSSVGTSSTSLGFWHCSCPVTPGEPGPDGPAQWVIPCEGPVCQRKLRELPGLSWMPVRRACGELWKRALPKPYCRDTLGPEATLKPHKIPATLVHQSFGNI